MTNLIKLKKEIVYKAQYRGTKEMDILLSNFVKKYIEILDNGDLEDLKTFLEIEDEIIYNFYFKKGKINKFKNKKILDLFMKFNI